MTEESKVLNKEIIETYDTSRFPSAIDCVMPGYFGGNKVLFIAQNPGQLKSTVDSDVAYLRAYQQKEYDKIDSYYIDALKSSRGTYGTFIHDIYGEDWSDISITNVFKCPFVYNLVPFSTPDKEKQLLTKQIHLLNPKIIVCVGLIARVAMKHRVSNHAPLLDVSHPSYLKKTGQYSEKVIEYKKQLHELLNNIVNN